MNVHSEKTSQSHALGLSRAIGPIGRNGCINGVFTLRFLMKRAIYDSILSVEAFHLPA